MLHYNTPLKLACPYRAFTVCCPIQQMVDRCFSAKTVWWADLYPFAVRILSLCTCISPTKYHFWRVFEGQLFTDKLPRTLQVVYKILLHSIVIALSITDREDTLHEIPRHEWIK